MYKDQLDHSFVCSCREEFSERYERAAAIAVFQDNLKTANDCLKEGAEKIINRGKKLEGLLITIYYYYYYFIIIIIIIIIL